MLLRLRSVPSGSHAGDEGLGVVVYVCFHQSASERAGVRVSRLWRRSPFCAQQVMRRTRATSISAALGLGSWGSGGMVFSASPL